MSPFQGVGMEEFHCIQRCPHFRVLEWRSSTVYRGVLISECWNGGVPLYTEVSSFQGVVPLYTEVSSFQGVVPLYTEVSSFQGVVVVYPHQINNVLLSLI